MQTDSMLTNHMFVEANQYWKNQNFIFDEQLSGKSKFYTQLSLWENLVNLYFTFYNLYDIQWL